MILINSSDCPVVSSGWFLMFLQGKSRKMLKDNPRTNVRSISRAKYLGSRYNLKLRSISYNYNKREKESERKNFFSIESITGERDAREGNDNSVAGKLDF